MSTPIVESMDLLIPGPPGLGVSAAALTAITDDITALEGSMTTVQGDITAVEGEVDVLQANIAKLNARWMTIPIDGGGSTIGTGVRQRLYVPASGTITAWRLMADQSGSIVIDLWMRDYPNIPSNSQSITTSEEPTLSGVQVNTDTSLNSGNGWALTAGQALWVNVDSATTVTYVGLGLLVAWSTS